MLPHGRGHAWGVRCAVCTQTLPNYPTCPWAGWASLFMRHINATWPHPGHTLLNLGMGGAMLSAYLTGGCILERLPAHMDLVILENLGGGTEEFYVEQVGGWTRGSGLAS